MVRLLYELTCQHTSTSPNLRRDVHTGFAGLASRMVRTESNVVLLRGGYVGRLFGSVVQSQWCPVAVEAIEVEVATRRGSQDVVRV